MDCMCVRFFVREGMRQDGQPIHDWLFSLARDAGIRGGSAFRASAGYGRHGLHEDTFFELAGELPETVEFIAEPRSIQVLVDGVAKAGLRLMYVSYPVKLAVTGDE